MPRNLQEETPPATPAPEADGEAPADESSDMLWFSLDFWGFDKAAITFDQEAEQFYFKVPVILTKDTGTFFILLDVVLEGKGFYTDGRPSANDASVAGTIIITILVGFGINYLIPGLIIFIYTLTCQKRDGHWSKSGCERYSLWIKIGWFISPLLLMLATVIVLVINRNDDDNFRISTNKEWVQRMRHDKDANDRNKTRKREAREALEAQENPQENGTKPPGSEESNLSESSNGSPEPKKEKRVDQKKPNAYLVESIVENGDNFAKYQDRQEKKQRDMLNETGNSF